MGNFFDLPIFDRNNTNVTNITLDFEEQASWTTHHVITFVILILEVLLIFSGNILVLVSIWINKAHLKPSYIFVISLTIADLFVGLVCVISLLKIGIEQDTLIGCLFQIVIIVMACAASIYSILVIAYDRYLAITKPLNYVQRMSKKREVILVIMIWTTAFLFALIPILCSSNSDYTGSCSFLVVLSPGYPIFIILFGFLPALLVMIYFYARIYSVSHKHSKQIRDLERTLQDVNHMRLARELKAAKTVAVVIGCFLFTWLPFFITLTVQILCTCDLQIVLNYLLLLGFSNSVLNPWVYVYWNKEAREKLCYRCQKKMARIRGRKSIPSDQSVSSISRNRRSLPSSDESYAGYDGSCL
ncbi:glucose-dependent insulinotropic receptor-like [Glandiceps talaboti]